MKATGMVRRVDDLGRIVLPMELRRMMDIAVRDELEIFLDDERIILQKYEKTCVFCGSPKGLINYRSKSICQECLREILEE